MAQFPGANTAAFRYALGARHFVSFVGELTEWSTMQQYAGKVRDWYTYNQLGGYDWRRVSDDKVCAFAGWLSDPNGRNSRDKTLNGWTSALNDHFDKIFAARPFNTHRISRLKKRYRERQVARTLNQLAVRPADEHHKHEAKDQRLAMSAIGFKVMFDDGVRLGGVIAAQVCLVFIAAVFLLRPNTVQGFILGDVYLDTARRIIFIFVRQVKRWPELRHTPAGREVQCGRSDTPLGAIFDLMVSTHANNPRWYLALARSASVSTAASVFSGWIRARCDDRVPRNSGRHFSGYSVRIAIASTMWAYRMDERWVQSWGYWKTAAQYLTYVRKHYGRHPYVASLVSFGFALQDGRPFDFSTRHSGPARSARPVGLEARRQQLRRPGHGDLLLLPS